MKKIFWSEGNISILTDKIAAAEHKHLMLHLFYKPYKKMQLIVEGEKIAGNCIIVDTDILHTLPETNDLLFFCCIDTTTETAAQLRKKYLLKSKSCTVEDNRLEELFDKELPSLSHSLRDSFTPSALEILGIKTDPGRCKKDARIQDVLREINSFSHIESTTAQIAQRFFLSESRLSHLFKKETGISLKSYLVLTKLQKAYKLIASGVSVTEAALESGFSSISHLADTNKRMMGMTITTAMKDSRFLEA